MGIVAAQSIKPALLPIYGPTYFSTVCRKTVPKKRTIGFPRMKELLFASPTLHMACVMVYLQDECCSYQTAKYAANRVLKYATLRDLASWKIYYDPDIRSTLIPEDADLVETYVELPDDDFDTRAWSPWLLRLEFDRKKLEEHHIRLSEIADKLKCPGVHLQLIYTDFYGNAEQLPIRVRFAHDTEEGDPFVILKRTAQTLLNIGICGILGVKEIFRPLLVFKLLKFYFL